MPPRRPAAPAQGGPAAPGQGGPTRAVDHRSARRARIGDVADQAGVSTATVSLVLRGKAGPSEATREAVRAAAEALGYRPDRTASTLARKRSHLLGVVLDLTQPFHADLVEALDVAAATHDLDLVLAAATGRRDERGAIETLLDSRCVGIAVLGPTAGEAVLEEVAQQCPVVLIGQPGTTHARGVRADDRHGAALAVEHLVALGHRRIAHVDGGVNPISAARRRGFRTAMRTAGLSQSARVLTGGPTEQAGLAAATQIAVLPAAERPTAVLAFNDRCAAGLRAGLSAGHLQAGLSVPADLSVIGWDDSPIARLVTNDLTTVSQGATALAEATVATLGALLEGSQVRDTVVAPTLIIRSSTAAAPPGKA